MQPTLTHIEDFARQAGEILRQGYRPRPGLEPGIQIYAKGIIDVVTEYDRRSEAFLLDQIQRHFPGHRVIAEESGELSGLDCCQWFIDPLDGTVNYAHGIPIFSVSIAYAEEGVLRLGAVYDPLREELFSAEHSHGAWLNGERIQVSNTEDFNQSLLVTGFPYDIRENPDNNLDIYARLTLLTQGVRRLGSAALDMCYVAAGRLDGFWEMRLSPWDIAAGGLIAGEAGAVVTDLEGNSDFMASPYSIMAANPYLHPKILKVFSDLARER
jgi:myo-inositol-1(or 4)-monophosphatase